MVQIIQRIIGVPLSPFVFGGRCPCYVGRAVSQVPPWRRHSCSHSCSSWRNCRPCFRLRKTAGFPQLQFIKVVHILVVGQRPIPMVLVTMESPQLQFDKVSSSCCAGCVAPQVQVVEVTVAIPQLHRVRHPRFVDIRVVTERQFPSAQLFSRPVRFSSCSSLIWCLTSLLCGSTGQVVSRPDVVDIPVMAQRQVDWVLTVKADHRASPVAVH